MSLRGEAHRAAIRAVLHAFGVDAAAFVFVGGCTFGLYARSAGAPLRVTKDVDCISTLSPWVLQEKKLADMCSLGVRPQTDGDGGHPGFDVSALQRRSCIPVVRALHSGRNSHENRSRWPCRVGSPLERLLLLGPCGDRHCLHAGRDSDLRGIWRMPRGAELHCRWLWFRALRLRQRARQG